MAHLAYAKKQYQHAKRFPTSPLQTLLTVYSEAITACIEKDTLRAIKALAALQLSLNPNDTSEISHQLNIIFEFCLQHVQEQNFTAASNALIELRSSMTA